MGYVIKCFDALWLPEYDSDTEASSNRAPANILEMSGGGGVDLDGSDRKVPESGGFSYKVSESKDTRTELQISIDAIRGKVGIYSRVYAQTLDGTYRWKYARLERVVERRRPGLGTSQPVDLVFSTPDPYWRGTRHGGPWYLDTGELLDVGMVLDLSDAIFPLDGSPKTVNVVNGGNAPCQVGNVEVLAETAPITSVTFERGTTIDWNYDASIAVDKKLLVDAGSSSVTNDGAADYEHHHLLSHQAIGPWFEVESGSAGQDFTITYVGGGAGSTVTLNYWDTWV